MMIKVSNNNYSYNNEFYSSLEIGYRTIYSWKILRLWIKWLAKCHSNKGCDVT